MARRVPARRYPCPGCATCHQSTLRYLIAGVSRRDRLLALAVIVVFVVVFVLPTVLRWHG